VSPRRVEDGSTRAKVKPKPQQYVDGGMNSGLPILSNNIARGHGDKEMGTGSVGQLVTEAKKVASFVASKSDGEAEGYEADAEKEN
jgi:hypothetical protein